MRCTIILILTLLLGLIPAAAQDAPESLAALMPRDALFYGEIRVDEQTIAGFDALIRGVQDRLGEPAPPVTITELLDHEGVRAWLGDEAAVAVLPPGEFAFSEGVIAVRIRDRAAAVAYFREQMDAMEAPAALSGTTFFISGGMTATISDDLLLVSSRFGGAAMPAPGQPSLADDSRFQQVMAALPAQDYAARFYVEPRSLVAAMNGGMDWFGSTAVNIPVLMDAVGLYGGGLTQLDARTYALDFVHLPGSRDMLEAFYLPPQEKLELTPVDPDFVSVVGDDTVLVLHGTRPWRQFTSSMEMLAVVGNAMRTRALLTGEFSGDMLRNPLALIPPSFTSAAALNLIEGMVSLSDAELAAAFDGDALFAARVYGAVDEPALDFLFAVESESFTVSQQIVEGMRSQVLPLIGVAPIESGDDEMLFKAPGGVLSSDVRLLADFDALYFGSDTMLIAGKQTLVAVPRLGETPAHEHDRDFFLDGATGLFYLHLPPLRPLVAEDGPSADSLPDDGPMIRAVLGAFDSVWVSARSEPERETARFAFTLAE